MKTTNDLMNVLNSDIKTESDLDNYIDRISEYQLLDPVTYYNDIRTRHGINGSARANPTTNETEVVSWEKSY